MSEVVTVSEEKKEEAKINEAVTEEKQNEINPEDNQKEIKQEEKPNEPQSEEKPNEPQSENKTEIINPEEKSEKEKAEEIIKEEELKNYHYSNYNKYKHYDSEDEDEKGNRRLSHKFIDKLLCENGRDYYRTHELNEILYLHFNSLVKIENLETFTSLKVLYLEGNGIKKIEGLECLVNLTSLYLHENIIEKIEGLDTLTKLYTLNLSDNLIKRIEGLSKLTNLSTLLLKRNRIGFDGMDDVKGLLEVNPTNFMVIDISDNHIETPEILPEVFEKMQFLRVIYFNGNPGVRKISNYRKTFISKIRDLKYLDDRPVFDDERRFAMAFSRGGLEEEKKERELYRKEEREKDLKRVRDFSEMFMKQTDNTVNNELTEKEKKEKEELREKQKLELLMKCKNKKKNQIFDDEDENVMPNVKKEESLKHVDNSIPKTNENESVPDLEPIKTEPHRINVNNNVKISAVEEEIDTTSAATKLKRQQEAMNQNKINEENNKENIKEENKNNENNKENVNEDNNEKGFKVEVRELDELD